MLKFIYKNLKFLSSGTEIGFFEKIRLKFKTERYQKDQVNFMGRRLRVSDVPSFLATYKEIFQDKIYEFKSKVAKPVIIDCGSNIGLSVIYLKLQHPNSEIIAFEPDPGVFRAMNDNLKAFGFNNIDARRQIVWIENGTKSFVSEGGLSGRIAENDSKNENLVSLETIRLKDLLNRKIEFLKIDIEGAEYEVLVDCKDELKNVEHIFIEYHSEQNKTQTLNEILEILSNAGFRYHIHEAFSSPQPFIEIKTMLNMDLQLNIYGYRI